MKRVLLVQIFLDGGFAVAIISPWTEVMKGAPDLIGPQPIIVSEEREILGRLFGLA